MDLGRPRRTDGNNNSIPELSTPMDASPNIVLRTGVTCLCSKLFSDLDTFIRRASNVASHRCRCNKNGTGLRLRPSFHCDAVEERPREPLRSTCRAAMKWLHLFSLIAAMTPWKWLARIAIASSSFSNRQEHRYNEQKTAKRYIRHSGQIEFII